MDRVIWFNLGNHHVPHTGDFPSTLMTTSASSVMFVTHNYHVRDRARALTNSVRIEATKDGIQPDVKTFGNFRCCQTWQASRVKLIMRGNFLSAMMGRPCSRSTASFILKHDIERAGEDFARNKEGKKTNRGWILMNIVNLTYRTVSWKCTYADRHTSSNSTDQSPTIR